MRRIAATLRADAKAANSDGDARVRRVGTRGRIRTPHGNVFAAAAASRGAWTSRTPGVAPSARRARAAAAPAPPARTRRWATSSRDGSRSDHAEEVAACENRASRPATASLRREEALRDGARRRRAQAAPTRATSRRRVSRARPVDFSDRRAPSPGLVPPEKRERRRAERASDAFDRRGRRSRVGCLRPRCLRDSNVSWSIAEPPRARVRRQRTSARCAGTAGPRRRRQRLPNSPRVEGERVAETSRAAGSRLAGDPPRASMSSFDRSRSRRRCRRRDAPRPRGGDARVHRRRRWHAAECWATRWRAVSSATVAGTHSSRGFESRAKRTRSSPTPAMIHARTDATRGGAWTSTGPRRARTSGRRRPLERRPSLARPRGRRRARGSTARVGRYQGRERRCLVIGEKTVPKREADRLRGDDDRTWRACPRRSSNIRGQPPPSRRTMEYQARREADALMRVGLSLDDAYVARDGRATVVSTEGQTPELAVAMGRGRRRCLARENGGRAWMRPSTRVRKALGTTATTIETRFSLVIVSASSGPGPCAARRDGGEGGRAPRRPTAKPSSARAQAHLEHRREPRPFRRRRRHEGREGASFSDGRVPFVIAATRLDEARGVDQLPDDGDLTPGRRLVRPWTAATAAWGGPN